MAIALDTTAHPAGAAITAAGDLGVGNPNLTSPSFSTAAGGRWIVVKLFADSGGTAPFPVTVSGAGLSGWAQVASGISTIFLNQSGTAIWMAWAPSTLTAQTITAAFQSNTSTIHYSLTVEAWVENAAGFTSTSPLGATASLVDDSGSNVAIHTPITPQATGSVLTGVWSTANKATGLTADSNTSAFEFSRNTADSTSFGIYKVSGSIATTTAATPVTFGATDSDAFDYCAAIEIKLPASSTPLAGVMAGSSAARGTLSEAVAIAGVVAASTAARPTLAIATALTGKMAGQGTAVGSTIALAALAGKMAGGGAVTAKLSPFVMPGVLVLPVSTSQIVVASPVPTWAILEGAAGGTIVAGTGGNATYTAPATPGTYHITATVGSAVTTILVTAIAAPANPTVRIDSPFQAMDGFGCAESDDEPAPLTSGLLDLLYDQTAGIGFSIHRVGINPDLSGPRHDPTDYAAAPWDLWYHIHQAMTRSPGLRVICGPWTPPNALKDNGSPTAGHLNLASYSTWANSLASFITLAAAQSPPITIYAISPQNEPDLGLSHDSCLFSDTQLRDFIKVLGPAIRALPAGQQTLVFAPEVSDPTQLETYLATLEADQAARSYTGIYATHQYGHAVMPAATRAGLPIWQTEMSGLTGGPEGTFDASITDGIAIAKWVHSAITAGNVSAWVWWWGFIAFNGTPPTTEADGENQALILTNGDTTTGITQFSLTKRLFTIGQFSKFIRPGYQRVNLIGTLPSNVSASAYVDPVSGRLVVVCINDSASTASLTLAVAGGTAPTSLTPYVTSGTALGGIGTSGNLERQTPIALSAGTLSATLAANSVTTFVAEAALAGVGAGGAALVGALTEAVALRGVMASASSSISNLGLGIPVALAGAMSGASASRGVLAVSVALAGVTSGQAVLAGALSEAVQLAARAAGGAALTGSLALGSLALAGVMGGGGAASGALSLALGLASAVSGASASSGAISLSVGLAASASGASAGSGILALAVRLAGLAVGGGAVRPTLRLGTPITLARGVLLRGQPTSFAILSGKSGFPTLNGQGDS